MLWLPPPTGSAPVGTTTLHLVDRARRDPLAPGKRPRQLMVQLWYPAIPSRRLPHAPYLPPAVAELLAPGFLPLAALRALHTDAHPSAPVAASDRTQTPEPSPLRISPRHPPWLVAAGSGHPVVLFSHGNASLSALSSALLQDLASHGYVVAAMNHPYNAAIVEFPDGRIVEYQQQDHLTGNEDLATWDAGLAPLLAVLVADSRFVLDALHQLQAGTNPDAEAQILPPGLVGALDLSRIGIMGHSLGGATAFQALAQDARLRAACALDSIIPAAASNPGGHRPVLLMQSEQPEAATLTHQAWRALHPRGWHRHLLLTGSGHNTFTDLAVFRTELGTAFPKELDSVMGTIDGFQAVAAQRAYVTAFFNQALTDRPSQLLDRPSPRYPQVRFLP